MHHLHKAAISEANVKTNRMASTKWTYHKERSFGSNYFIRCINQPNAHIGAGVLFDDAFSL